MKKLSLIFILSIILLTVTACNDNCGENMNAIPLAGFYVAGEKDEQVRVDSLEVRGIGAPSDSILSSPSETKTQLFLPFRIDSDTTSYLFTMNVQGYSLASEVTFVYSRTPRFAEAECGVSYIYDIKKIECTGNLIDSVTCPGGFIDNTNIENLRIYLASGL